MQLLCEFAGAALVRDEDERLKLDRRVLHHSAAIMSGGDELLGRGRAGVGAAPKGREAIRGRRLPGAARSYPWLCCLGCFAWLASEGLPTDRTPKAGNCLRKNASG